MKEKRRGRGVSLNVIGTIIASFVVVISTSLIIALNVLSSQYEDVTSSTQNYVAWKNVANDIQIASDYLTDRVRSYVVLGEKKYMDNYFEESDVSKRREKALDIIKEHLENTEVYSYVSTAIDESMDLMNLEYKAMRLVADVKGTDYSKYTKIAEVDVSSYASLSDQEKLRASIDIVYGDEYIQKKDTISYNINHAVTSLDTMMEDRVIKSSLSLKNLLILQQALIGANIIFLFITLGTLFFLIVRPASKAVDALENNEEIDVYGVKELNYIAEAYNRVYEQNINVQEKLVYEAEHDKLTGLYNRTGYDAIYRRMSLDLVVYILIDADNFKDINDKYGHIVGDKVLIRIAHTIQKYFSDDVGSYIFRIGGDEFAIVIENFGPKITDNLIDKLKKMSMELEKEAKDVPAVTLSIGVAHGRSADTSDTLFKKADKALYRVKRNGRHDIAVSE